MAAAGANRPELYEEVKLYKNIREREKYDTMADLYAVINTLQCLEKAYIKDAVNAKDYQKSCATLLTQYKSAFKLVHGMYNTVEDFMKAYKMDCSAALERIREGRPLTVKDDAGNTTKCVADIVSGFITTMDALKLDQKSVDEVQPYLRELYDTMNRLSTLPADFEGKLKINTWLQTLGNMQASDELDDGQIRQLLHDLDSAYASFNNFLHHQ
ncbi:hypothetical protein EB796_001401 [Bugula neritina]|uniref:Vacuolar protein sorting-associated protein 28 homolog n=1 Tax=Bugula neritina TaxID=10212 RepID=A0A7J7KQ15_BUGNE|nr:hypothetical protein EB796_001401 [Bugula neritina]